MITYIFVCQNLKEPSLLIIELAEHHGPPLFTLDCISLSAFADQMWQIKTLGELRSSVFDCWTLDSKILPPGQKILSKAVSPTTVGALRVLFIGKRLSLCYVCAAHRRNPI